MRDPLLLTPKASTNNYKPNYAFATGEVNFTAYSQAPSTSLATEAKAKVFLKGGPSTAISGAMAKALTGSFAKDKAFSELFSKTASVGVGEDGPFEGSSKSQTKVIANFSVKANQEFSFNFDASSEVEAKEVENSNIEYNRAFSKIGYLLIDITNPSKAKIVDYGGSRTRLISPVNKPGLLASILGKTGTKFSYKEFGKPFFGSSKNVTITEQDKTSDLDGNNGEDSVTAEAKGTYKRTFSKDSDLLLVQVNKSFVKFAGDYNIGNLGEGVKYGSLWRDRFRGTNRNDKYYASLGNDWINGRGGDDTLEGGEGKDTIIGGYGNDHLVGGADDDHLTGGRGKNKFYFANGWGVDKITDFKPDEDKIVLSKSSFSALGSSIDAAEFAVVTNDTSAATSDALITYSQSTGNLSYDGSQFATLQDTPTLSYTDLSIY